MLYEGDEKKKIPGINQADLNKLYFQRLFELEKLNLAKGKKNEEEKLNNILENEANNHSYEFENEYGVAYVSKFRSGTYREYIHRNMMKRK